MRLTFMTNSRAALSIGGATLLVAWLSFAGSPGVQPVSPLQAGPAGEAGSTESLVADVRAQGERLRQRLAASPPMQQPARNPFAFGSARSKAAVPSEPLPRVGAEASQTTAEEPPLALMGIAEHRRAGGTARTAVIVSGADELLMVTVGDPVGQRYRVVAIGSESVELFDAVAERGRRLTLQR